MNQIQYYNRPLLFYSFSILLPWTAWFLAAYFSHIESSGKNYATLSGTLMLIGLASPATVAFTMMFTNHRLRNDFFNRLFNFSNVQPIYLFLTFLLMPTSILLAQAISILFGYSVEQFNFSHKASFAFSLFPAWVMLLLAPTIEELAWHSYGTDCLRAKFNLFISSIIFAIFWVLWHFPVSFVKGYYHANVAEESWIYSVNFMVSLFPFVLLMNWLYYRTHRNILLAIVFHVTAGLFNELFATHSDSKIIQTALLVMLSCVVVYKERNLFFKKTLPIKN